MKLIMGFFTLVFVGLAIMDLATAASIFPNTMAQAYVMSMLIKLALGIVSGIMAFQKKPDGV